MPSWPPSTPPGARRCSARVAGHGGGAITVLQFRFHRAELRGRDLLLQAGDFSLRVEFAQAAIQLRDLQIVLVLGLLGFDLCAQRVGGRFAAFGTVA